MLCWHSFVAAREMKRRFGGKRSGKEEVWEPKKVAGQNLSCRKISAWQWRAAAWCVVGSMSRVQWWVVVRLHPGVSRHRSCATELPLGARVRGAGQLGEWGQGGFLGG